MYGRGLGFLHYLEMENDLKVLLGNSVPCGIPPKQKNQLLGWQRWYPTLYLFYHSHSPGESKCLCLSDSSIILKAESGSVPSVPQLGPLYCDVDGILTEMSAKVALKVQMKGEQKALKVSIGGEVKEV